MLFRGARLYTLILLLLLAVVGTLWSALLHRPMYHEGSDWYFQILQGRRLFYDANVARFTDMLLQVPAYLAHIYVPGASPRLPLLLLDLAYSFHPLLSLLGVFFILKHYNRTDLFVFPLLSYFALSLPASLFSLGLGAQLLSLFWPLFFLMLLSTFNSVRSVLSVIVLIVLLSVLHEIAVVVMPILIWVALDRRKVSHWTWFFVSLLVVTIFWQSYQIYLLVQKGLPGTARLDLRYHITPYHLTAIFVVFASLLQMLATAFKRRRLIWATAALIIISICLYLAYYHQSQFAYSARVNRLMTPQLATLIAALALLLEWRKKALHSKTLAWTLLASFAFFIGMDWTATKRWEKDVSWVRNRIQNAPGCPVISEFEANSLRGFHFHLIPLASVVLQEDRKIGSVLFADSPLCGAEKNLCRPSAFDYLVAPCAWSLPVGAEKYYDFSEIIFRTPGKVPMMIGPALKREVEFMPRAQALAMNIFFDPVANLRRKLQAHLMYELNFYTGWNADGEAHITVVTPPEFDVLKSRLSMDEINSIALAENIQQARFQVAGLGEGRKGNDKTYFIITPSEDLLKIRRKIQRAFIAKGAKASDWNPEKFFPHITLGYTTRDLHESDGVLKDVRHSLSPDYDLQMADELNPR